MSKRSAATGLISAVIRRYCFLPRRWRGRCPSGIGVLLNARPVMNASTRLTINVVVVSQSMALDCRRYNAVAIARPGNRLTLWYCKPRERGVQLRCLLNSTSQRVRPP
jgi:hypothetical protein